MTIDEALLIVDKLLYPEQLTDIQQFVFCQSWMGKTYSEIAHEVNYDPDYMKEVGSQLWSILSESLGEKVNKKNIQSALRQYQQKFPHAIASSDSVVELEFPGQAVPLDSKFYIERPPIEELAYAEVIKAGSLMRIKAARQMGKTSLLQRILAHAKTIGLHTVNLNLQQADTEILTDLDQFLRWFCINISRQLNLVNNLDDYWDEDMGSKMSCTVYFQSAILEVLEKPLVLALDEVNRIFAYPQLCGDFLPLLRSWHEEAGELGIWRDLHLIVVHNTEVYVSLNVNQSPFNVGFPLKLPEFTLSEVQSLAQRHELTHSTSEEREEICKNLMEMVGGHPYLIRLALYYLARGNITIETLLKEAPTPSGIYSDHLRKRLIELKSNPPLIAAMKQVINTPSGVALEAISAYQLESMGLVHLSGVQAFPSCQLYRLYFQAQLNYEGI